MTHYCNRGGWQGRKYSRYLKVTVSDPLAGSPSCEFASPHRWQSWAVDAAHPSSPATGRHRHNVVFETHIHIFYLSCLHSLLLHKHTPACKNSIHLKMERNGTWKMKQKNCFASTKSEYKSEMQSGLGLSALHKCLILCANNLHLGLTGHYKRQWWWQP